jgi:ketosteroid isomerase-like protein
VTVNSLLESQIRRLFEAVDDKDTGYLAHHFAHDVTFRFGNADVVEGRPEVVATCEAFLAGIAGIRHEIEHLWQVDADRVVAVMTVHYEKLDGGRLSLPCANTFRVRDGEVNDYWIYMDITPVLGMNSPMGDPTAGKEIDFS